MQSWDYDTLGNAPARAYRCLVDYSVVKERQLWEVGLDDVTVIFLLGSRIAVQVECEQIIKCLQIKHL